MGAMGALRPGGSLVLARQALGATFDHVGSGGSAFHPG
jgi:hypothetical protein